MRDGDGWRNSKSDRNPPPAAQKAYRGFILSGGGKLSALAKKPANSHEKVSMLRGKSIAVQLQVPCRLFSFFSWSRMFRAHLCQFSAQAGDLRVHFRRKKRGTRSHG